MQICHFTNTFLPHVGGVARAVQTLLEDQRSARHRVLIVAPEFATGATPKNIERHVARIPALTQFNDSDFSVRIPLAASLSDQLTAFKADLIHAHHPFLLGDTALREAASRQVPIIFTHHTLYERYTHYLPLDSEPVQELAAEIATRFANCCDAVIAPSQSIADLLKERGVVSPIHAIPTGIDTALIAQGDSNRARQRLGLPARAQVIGHLGRLADEKNLPFLAEAIARALKTSPAACALIVGDGPAREKMESIFAAQQVASRVVFAGLLSGQRLRDACAAMDLFAFASTSETQGLVLAEAMAAGTPVIALDASGVREVVRDGRNGRLLPTDAPASRFARALTSTLADKDRLSRWKENALATALTFDRKKTSARLLAVYQQEIQKRRAHTEEQSSLAQAVAPVVERIAIEGKMIADKTAAIFNAIASSVSPTTETPAKESNPDAKQPALANA